MEKFLCKEMESLIDRIYKEKLNKDFDKRQLKAILCFDRIDLAVLSMYLMLENKELRGD